MLRKNYPIPKYPKYYVNKGAKLLDKNGEPYYQRYRVDEACPSCGEVRKVGKYYPKTICRSCSIRKRLAETDTKRNGTKRARDIGKTGRPYARWIWDACPDCRKERWLPINRKGSRCQICAGKERSKNTIPKIKPIRYCKDCGIPVAAWKRFCQECANKRNTESYLQHYIARIKAKGKDYGGYKIITEDKLCRACGKRFPRTPEYFGRHIKSRDGLSSKCRACHSKEKRQQLQTPKGRFRASMTTAIYRTIKGQKNGHTWQSLVGYTLLDLKTHLERQFQPNMTWDNYGMKGWVIDHIRPVASFHFDNPSDPDFKKCWALTNLQPMWMRENSIKGVKPGRLVTGKLC